MGCLRPTFGPRKLHKQRVEMRSISGLSDRRWPAFRRLDGHWKAWILFGVPRCKQSHTHSKLSLNRRLRSSRAGGHGRINRWTKATRICVTE